MKKILLLGMLSFLVLGISIESLADGIDNGDFSDGLTGWTSDGDVSVIDGYAVIGGNEVLASSLFQSISLLEGRYTLEFDFLNDLSDYYPTQQEQGTGAFPDYLWASLYDSSEEALLDLSGIELNLDNAYNGQISQSTFSNDWLHYSVAFQSYENTPVGLEFYLLEQNTINNDSFVAIDNVSIAASAVPEPSTLLLIGCGIIGLAGVARKRYGKRN